MRFFIFSFHVFFSLCISWDVVSQDSVAAPATARLFSREIGVFDSINLSHTYPTDAVLFTGSSSIKLWNTMLEDMPGINAVNRGFGGSRVEDVAYYLPTILAGHPWRAIVIMAGSNNISGGANDMPLDSILFYTNYIIRKIRKQYPAVPVFWIAITPTWSRISVLDRVRQMNERWKEFFMLQEKVCFIDTFPHFINSEGKPRSEFFRSDQLHLNREGYRLWGDIIGRELTNYLD
jgi:lysophospholipase L1-like esterase